MTRYSATFDSLNPERGVVVDEVDARYALFPSVERAENAADKMNRAALDIALPNLANVLTWRSTITGRTIEPTDTAEES